ncbi:hypothetical protein MZK49_23725 [Ensifer sesbaniae]|uniref:hypothetical protein n=1 Tax=Ensifer sesbaniae TaxID=1214071 RepID=UPI002001A4FA|nr:hypothetical protein [Ensifer sesbaniae]
MTLSDIFRAAGSVSACQRDTWEESLKELRKRFLGEYGPRRSDEARNLWRLANMRPAHGCSAAITSQRLACLV